jgi:hypothetical protein
MAISATLDDAGERPRSLPARLYLAHERLAIGGGTLLALLLAWEAFARSGLVDPLFISSPTQIVKTGWQLGHTLISGTTFGSARLNSCSATAPRPRSRFRSDWRSACPSACNTCSALSSILSMRCRG